MNGSILIEQMEKMRVKRCVFFVGENGQIQFIHIMFVSAFCGWEIQCNLLYQNIAYYRRRFMKFKLKILAQCSSQLYVFTIYLRSDPFSPLSQNFIKFILTQQVRWEMYW